MADLTGFDCLWLVACLAMTELTGYEVPDWLWFDWLAMTGLTGYDFLWLAMTVLTGYELPCWLWLALLPKTGLTACLAGNSKDHKLNIFFSMISSVLLCGFDQGHIHIPWTIHKSKLLFQTTVVYICTPKSWKNFRECHVKAPRQ